MQVERMQVAAYVTVRHWRKNVKIIEYVINESGN